MYGTYAMAAISLATLVSLVLFAPKLRQVQKIGALAVISRCTGTAMPVVQMTVQAVAGPKFLGAAAASVQFSRSVGPCSGRRWWDRRCSHCWRAQDPRTAAIFTDLVDRGPSALTGLTMAQRALLGIEIAMRSGVRS